MRCGCSVQFFAFITRPEGDSLRALYQLHRSFDVDLQEFAAFELPGLIRTRAGAGHQRGQRDACQATLPERTLSARELICIMFSGVNRLDKQSPRQSYANFFRLALGYDAQGPEVNKSAHLPRYCALRDRKTLCDITYVRRLIVQYIR